MCEFERLMGYNGDKYDFYEDYESELHNDPKIVFPVFLYHNAIYINKLSNDTTQFIVELCNQY